MRSVLAALTAILVLGFVFGMSAMAGPDDASQFRDTPYAAQKALYEFNFAEPGDGMVALRYIENQLRGLEVISLQPLP